MIAGLLAGAVVVAVQAFAIRRFAPDSPVAGALFALPLAGLFVGALLLLDAEDADLGLVSAQVALIAMGPELAGPGEPDRRLGRFLLALQAFAAALALYAWLGMEDPVAAVPLAVAVVALERCRRHAAPVASRP